jgi:hypothetical protein
MRFVVTKVAKAKEVGDKGERNVKPRKTSG